jgi:phosphatidylserine/phosphatidylglycerophosphate/cardiolipin synthase-like enzyme
MEVVYFQVVIIASLLAVFFIKRAWLLYACIGWSIFTVRMVFTSQLMAIQLVVIWGTYFLSQKLIHQRESIDELELAVSSLSERQRSLATRVDAELRSTLTGVEHHRYLLKSLARADSSIVVLSGWVSDYVVDKDFVGLLKKRLKAGLRVYIGYGYEGRSGVHEQTESSERAIRQLNDLAGWFNGQLHIARYATHEKLLIIDERVVVYGSANWLNNRKYMNAERSVVLEEPALAAVEFERVTEQIHAHELKG